MRNVFALMLLVAALAVTTGCAEKKKPAAPATPAPAAGAPAETKPAETPAK